MKSSVKRATSKNALFEAVSLIESFAVFQNDDLAK